jgi:hypothetical protein
VLLSTAMATWLPTIPLSRALWFGMDRYLYTSLFLLLFTAARPLWQVLAGRADLRRPAFGAGLLVLLAASASTFVASGFYRDHHAWVFSAIEEAPEDPTRYVVAASELHMNGHDDAARTVFRTLPPPPYPRAVWEQALLVALQLGLVSEFTDMATVALAAYPSDPAIALLGVHAALLHNDAGRAVELMQVVEGSPFCAEGRARLLSWCGTQPDSEERARVLAAANSLSCPGGGTSASP